MIYTNLIMIPVNAYLAGALDNGWVKTANAVSALINVAVVAAHLASHA